MIDNVARNEFEAIMKCTQEVSQVKETISNKEQLKVKRNREQEQKTIANTSICFKVRATALLPAVKGFHYPPRTLQGLPKTGVPNSTTYKNLYQRDISTRGTQRTSNQVITIMITNLLQHFSFTTPYRMRIGILALEV